MCRTSARARAVNREAVSTSTKPLSLQLRLWCRPKIAEPRLNAVAHATEMSRTDSSFSATVCVSRPIPTIVAHHVLADSKSHLPRSLRRHARNPALPSPYPPPSPIHAPPGALPPTRKSIRPSTDYPVWRRAPCRRAPGAHPRRVARPARHLHAQAVRQPHRLGLPRARVAPRR
eukprot:6194415-Pleurochrysis_carterae.AAC.1